MLFYSYVSSPGYFLRSIFPPISAIAFPSPNPGKSTELSCWDAGCVVQRIWTFDSDLCRNLRFIIHYLHDLG